MTTSACRRTLENQDRPLPFSSSKAKTWDPVGSFQPPKRDRPWYEPICVLVALGAFLLHFLVLREENDWDEAVASPLYDRVPGLEAAQLKQNIDYYERLGKDTTAFRERLQEIEKDFAQQRAMTK